ncbi:hypothetical protein F2Q69_00020812 [Brassica cretica]|uniref:Calcineurin-like phosphoesterase domain-containing protein n=1 Tax=Brassica cretica TaxID=69181 RepID=A0A8S9QFH9_BRACR|nr:hypothetical protein F2Q69_00020812 [Brassica cretica]
MAGSHQNWKTWGRIQRLEADVVIEFLDKNDFDLICQGHQVVEDRYEFFVGD